ncbi:MAG TPA: hypothetical protein VMN37_12425 [Gemmatimonadales bacterium]|nr:hypothetical protein [Gemmatimonadales bacterium]
MTRLLPRWVGAALLLLIMACGSDATGPATGGLAVTVSGLPSGAAADVTVTGPVGFTRTLGGSATLNGLTPGSYDIVADPVSAASAVYAGSPASQTITVAGGATPVPAQVTYAVTSGALAVTIAGLPAGTSAAVEVTGPSGFQAALTGSATLTGLVPGSYVVTASPVNAGSQYSPSPGTQQVTVSTGGTAAAAVTYADDGVSGLNYRIDGVYLTQSVQTYAGSVPLVANRDGYLRVFVTASELNAPSPDVRVRFYHGGTLVSEQTIVRVGTTPLAPQEGTLSSSWNLPVSKSLIQPGLSLRVDVDPANLLPEADEGDNHFPASGLPLVPEVQTAATFRATLVPVTTSVDGRTGNVTGGNQDQFFAATMKMHPLASYDAAVGAPLTIGDTVPALESNNTNNAWNTVLSQLHARRIDDGSTRYYLGIVNPNYSSGVAGIGYVGFPVALAWDKLPSAASVAAHEWGHNWKRQHAPCGGAGNPDTQFPYAGGVIGVYGFDVAAQALKATTSHDLMGYCNNEWISDYTYQGVMQYRSAETGISDALGEAVQPALVVWGRIENGRMVLEPAFQASTRPSLPATAGPYRLEARAADGSRIFGLSFEPLEVADDPQGARHFAFAVPLAPERAARVARLRAEGEGRSAELARSGAEAARVEITQMGAGRVALTWDASRTPMVVVRDPRSGRILSFGRGGRAEIVTDQTELALTLSDRLQSREARIRVPSR